jgi:hypothetical protein
VAKALFGHLGPAPDVSLASTVRALRARVTELENEVDRLRVANAALLQAAQLGHDLSADVPSDLRGLQEDLGDELLDLRHRDTADALA